MNKTRKETLEKQLNSFVIYTIIIGIGCIIGGIFKIFNSYTDYLDNIIEQGPMVQQVIKETMIFAVGVTSIFIIHNIKRKKLFISSTASLIATLGLILILGGFMQEIACDIWEAPDTSHMLENAVGILLLTISQIFRIGIKIKEENDLTI